MLFFPRTLLTLCCALLLIQLQIVECSVFLACIGVSLLFNSAFIWFKFQSHQGDYGAVLQFFTIDATDSFILVFISCELGHRLTDAFNDFNDIIDQFKLYLFSIEVKRIIPTIMLSSQKPVRLECFGSISCCREVFQQVCSCNSPSNAFNLFPIPICINVFALDLISDFEEYILMFHGTSTIHQMKQTISIFVKFESNRGDIQLLSLLIRFHF